MYKASGGDGIPSELFQILKDDATSAALNMPAKLSSGHRTGKGVFNTIPKKRNAKECSNYPTIALISNAIKAVLKIVQAKLQQYMNRELPDIQVGFRKGRESRDQIVNICCIIEKQENSRTSTSALLTTPKSLTMWITTDCGKF